MDRISIGDPIQTAIATDVSIDDAARTADPVFFAPDEGRAAALVKKLVGPASSFGGVSTLDLEDDRFGVIAAASKPLSEDSVKALCDLLSDKGLKVVREVSLMVQGLQTTRLEAEQVRRNVRDLYLAVDRHLGAVKKAAKKITGQTYGHADSSRETAAAQNRRFAHALAEPKTSIDGDVRTRVSEHAELFKGEGFKADFYGRVESPSFEGLENLVKDLRAVSQALNLVMLEQPDWKSAQSDGLSTSRASGSSAGHETANIQGRDARMLLWGAGHVSGQSKKSSSSAWSQESTLLTLDREAFGVLERAQNALERLTTATGPSAEIVKVRTTVTDRHAVANPDRFFWQRERKEWRQEGGLQVDRVATLERLAFPARVHVAEHF